MAETERDRMRSYTLGRTRPRRTVSIEWEGMAFEVRAPTAGEYDEIMRALDTKLVDGHPTERLPASRRPERRRRAAPRRRGLAEATDAGATTERDDAADHDALLTRQHANDDFVQVLGNAGLALLHGTAEDAAAAGKVSPTPPADSGSSG